ncbi:MAG: hypothetical protein CVV28_09675 [Methanobacteriales archaeon HGW-Methanobacteriales-1]|jgi:parallel beta-helix repeat protein|nr:MAG: hypothetical protein CVV28_09675 [Methanobacteriales archaeon HGW-Methanobacteriales-1]
MAGLIFLNTIIEPVSATTIQINNSSTFDTSIISLNQQLQNIINNASNGDTLEFLGNYYDNISLIISKPLNIISHVKTLINGSANSTVGDNYVFLINGTGSSGTNITGFNLQSSNGEGIVLQNTSKVTISQNNLNVINGTGILVNGSSNNNVLNNSICNSKTGISIKNSKNTALTSNTIKNNVNNGLEIENSQNTTINRNNISSNGNDAISLENTKDTSINDNVLEKNGNNAITLENTSKTTINKNNITKNQGHGIYFGKDVNDTKITYNNINNNKRYGVALAKSGANTLISHNNITGNIIGINVNDSTDNLVISQNIITNSIINGYEDHSGVGINFGSNYMYSSTFKVNNNAIYGSQRRDVEIHDTEETVIFGANWYGSSTQSGCNFCPKLQTSLITVRLVQSTNGSYNAVFYDGDKIANLIPGIKVYYKMKDGSIQEAYMENGISSVPNDAISYIITYDRGNVPKSDSSKHPDNGNNGENSGNGKTGTGNGTGSGDGGNNGDGFGNGAQGSISSSMGTISATASAASSDSSSSAGSSSDTNKPKTATEIFLNDASKNPQIWSIIGIVLLIFLILIAYYWKDIRNMMKK